MRLAELFLTSGAQVIALDWVGIWWSLRLAANGKDVGFPDVYIFGGEHADVDLRPESGALMADLVVDRHISVVLDVMHFRKSERTRFATAFVKQSGQHGDCGPATLASLCGVSYEDALVACAAVAPTVLTEGMSWREMRLGVPTKLLRRGQYGEDSTGIIGLTTRHRLEHVAILWESRVLEGNGEHWLNLDSYCAAYGYRPGSLLIRTDLEHQAATAREETAI